MYEDQVEKRTYNICGKSYEFTAVKSDHGTWDGGGGPIGDWPDHLAIWTKHIRNYEVVVQAGGAQGLYPRLLSEMFQRVYTFEPDGLEFHCLVQNCQSDNIFKLNAALGETTGLVTLHRNSPDNMGMNTMSIESDSKIPMLTIDSQHRNL